MGLPDYVQFNSHLPCQGYHAKFVSLEKMHCVQFCKKSYYHICFIFMHVCMYIYIDICMYLYLYRNIYTLCPLRYQWIEYRQKKSSNLWWKKIHRLIVIVYQNSVHIFIPFTCSFVVQDYLELDAMGDAPAMTFMESEVDSGHYSNHSRHSSESTVWWQIKNIGCRYNKLMPSHAAKCSRPLGGGGVGVTKKGTFEKGKLIPWTCSLHIRGEISS